MSARILLVCDTTGGNTYRMAQRVARGVDSVSGCEALLRAVEKVGPTSAERTPEIPEAGAPYADASMLADCDALILGAPTHCGNMSASVKHFLDGTTEQWFGGTLAGKPAGAFVSTGSPHGGQESTLLSMMLPLSAKPRLSGPKATSVQHVAACNPPAPGCKPRRQPQAVREPNWAAPRCAHQWRGRFWP